MIGSLSVTGYRGFGNYRVEKTTQINLFVGKNNVGKTSLIEAVQLLSSITPLNVLGAIARRRNEGARMIDRERARYVELVDISHAFCGHKISGSEIKLSGDGIGELRLSAAPLDKATKSRGEGAVASFLPTTYSVQATRAGKLVASAEITDGGYMEDVPRIRRVTPDDRALFISPESLTSDYLPMLYNNVVRLAAEQRVVDSLQILDPLVTGVYFLAGGAPADITPGGILLGRNGSERNPLGSYGDGMRRLLVLSMAFVNVINGVLLIDEVDTGLHYSVMADLWRLVVGTARETNTQVFATTHSLDCVRGLHQILLEDPSAAVNISVHKIDGRQDRAVSFSGEKLSEALDADLELR